LRNALPPRRRPASGPLSQVAAIDTGPPAATRRSGERVLVIAPSWVGDAILSEPLIASLRKAAGEPAVIDVVAPPWCGPVYARMSGIAHIIDAPAGHGQFALRERRRLGIALRAARYARAYVLPNTWKSALVPWFARIPVRVGYRGEARYGLLTEARNLDARAMPQLVTRYAALADAVAAPPLEPPAPVLVPDAENLAAAMQALELTRVKPVAVLCPGAEYGPAKRWPAEHFADVARRFVADGYAVWIVGSPNDRTPAAALIAALGTTGAAVRDLTGRTDLGTAIDLMSIASIVISNDSGLMHAAAAVRAPLVALFGSSSPAYTPPLSDTAKVARIDIVCSPCFERVCPLGHFRCMRELSPELVYNLARPTPLRSAPASG
jgi:heptosyltransferase-2